jgi:Co/Zn/Cd efflux system component
MSVSDSSGNIDFWKIAAAVAQLVLGVVVTLNSRGVWVEVAFVDIRGFDEWYGKLVFGCGLVMILAAILSALSQMPSSYRIITQIISFTSSLAAVTVVGIFGLRVNQISADISDRARSPERWLEGTILEGFGKILADAAESISENLQPSLTSVWRWILIASIISALINALQLWRTGIHKRNISASSEDTPNSAW